MIKLLSLLGFTTISVLSYSQVTILNEDFESGFPVGFSDTILDSNTCDNSVLQYNDGWIIVSDVLNPTNNVAGASSFFDPTGTANRWLISSPLALGAYGNSLTWKARSHDASFPDGYRIFISTTGSAISDFTDTLTTVGTELETWTSHTINLSDSGYNSQTIYVAFALQSTDKYILYLDDIFVEKENTSSITEATVSSISLYPNPTQGKITIETDKSINTIYLIDLQGNKQKLNTDSNLIDLSTYSNGVYFIRVELEDGSSETKRIVKN